MLQHSCSVAAYARENIERDAESGQSVRGAEQTVPAQLGAFDGRLALECQCFRYEPGIRRGIWRPWPRICTQPSGTGTLRLAYGRLALQFDVRNIQ